jgi:hypothetical protein
MFSHIIYNPNQISIVNDYYVIPCGHRCASAIACQYASLRKFSLPFDWTIPATPKKIKNVLENDFQDYIPCHIEQRCICNKYGILLTHFNKDTKLGIEEYKRRIERFRNLLTHGKKIYFIYINEDYLYNKIYRTDDFNNTNFNEMLKLENYFKSKNLDYAILYFNFKQDIIPLDSKIINIVLNTNCFFNIEQGSPYQECRQYCGKILSELFNTTITKPIIDFDN